jgi:hypothetical protein
MNPRYIPYFFLFIVSFSVFFQYEKVYGLLTAGNIRPCLQPKTAGQNIPNIGGKKFYAGSSPMAFAK